MKTQLKLLLCLVFLVSTLVSMPAYAGFAPLSGIKTPQGDEIPLDKEDSDGEFHKGVVDTPVDDTCDYTDGKDGCSVTVTDPTPATETEEPQAADADNSQEPSDESVASDDADTADEPAAADEPDAADAADAADEADDADESTESDAADEADAEDSGDEDDDEDSNDEE